MALINRINEPEKKPSAEAEGLSDEARKVAALYDKASERDKGLVDFILEEYDNAPGAETAGREDRHFSA